MHDSSNSSTYIEKKQNCADARLHTSKTFFSSAVRKHIGRIKVSLAAKSVLHFHQVLSFTLTLIAFESVGRS